ncbi:AMP-binding protein [Marichromatium bheemlicum]|uniref:Phenylacetate--CoA ligase family protein n=1 Tax=Marichromatium bheemlicum TaxID=365339 RepID=A0ABX1IEH4_9GAMM|nr:AMP-binding protein [Marichromatium bheemlicum]NKN34557.1 phenylacetate--CoA ligase family protein [Marichromatium bheemlicum]
MTVRSWLKNIAVGDLIRRTPGFYGYFRALLQKIDHASFNERKLITDRLLETAHKTAIQTPYAHTRNIQENDYLWPYLEKETLRDAHNLFRRRSFLPLSKATTGGTTGIPLKCVRSWRSVVFEQAVFDHLAALNGVSWKKSRIAILRGETVKDPSDLTPPFWIKRHGGKQLSLSSNHLNASTISFYIEALRQFQPELLWVYPTSLKMLCRLAPEGRFELPTLKLVFSSSEVLTPEMNEQARSMLCVPIIDYYGQAERVCASYSTRVGEHYFLPAYGHVELVFSYDDPEFDFYEIVGTPYWNEAQPLVRYRTGDYARAPKGLTESEISEICLGIRPFFGVSGRQSDYLISPEGGRLKGLGSIVRDIPDVVQMQLHQTALDTIQIHVLPMPGYSQETEKLILHQARQKIPESMKIEVVCVDRLYRTKRGKAPLVVRTIAS